MATATSAARKMSAAATVAPKLAHLIAGRMITAPLATKGYPSAPVRGLQTQKFRAGLVNIGSARRPASIAGAVNTGVSRQNFRAGAVNLGG